ncbi:MAG: hypothetical protein ACE5HV_18405, partial [Acidobacteriota bacterium]
ELSSRLLANRNDLERLVRVHIGNVDRDVGEGESPLPDGHPLAVLDGWRRQVAGEDLLRVLRGELWLGIEAGGGPLRLVTENQKGPPSPSTQS